MIIMILIIMMMVGLWFDITLNFYKVLTVNEQDNCDEHGNENLYVNYQDSSIDQHNHDLKITDQSILKLYSKNNISIHLEIMFYQV